MGDTSKNHKDGNIANTVLSAGYSYIIGKFQVILNEDTQELKVIVCTNKDRLMIKPNTDNSCTIVACR